MPRSSLQPIPLLFTILAVILTAIPANADDWPQFRGANCRGISADEAKLPLRFSTTENVGWSTDVGDGIGGTVIADGRLFVTGMTDKETVSLFAFDAATGRPLWRRDWATGKLAEIHSTNSHASTTPVADTERVCFYFSTLGLIAVDAATGEDRWRQRLPVPFFVMKWGPGVSPVLYRDLVIFCQDDDLSPALYAFDKTTGTLRWKDDRSDMAVNYTHPVICSVDGRDDIVVAGTGRLIGYNPETGERRWFAQTLLRNIKTTPVCHDGVIYVSVQSGGIANQWLVAVDQAETGNKDGRISKAEVQAYVGETPIPEEFFRRTFDRGDVNHDGILEGQELDLAFLDPSNFAGTKFTELGDKAAEQFILAVRGGGTGDVTKTHLLWKHATKHTDHIVSPFVSDGRMFLVKEGGINTVFDTATGNPLRSARRLGNNGGYYASPVCGDGKLYLAGDNGKILVLRNDAQYEELALNDLGEAIIATPAIAGGKLFIRTRTKVYCFVPGEKDG